MANILLLTHRIPYPPDKGDKIHTYHLLRHLGQRHHLMLGTFVDDPGDEQHVPHVRSLCADLHAARLYPSMARLRCLGGLARSRSLSVEYYRDAGMARWVQQASASCRVDAVVVHSSTMLQYAQALQAPLIADMNDVDSAKWGDYGRSRRGPMAWVYRRESVRLLQEERRGAQQARLSLFATRREAALFRSLAPETAARVDVLGNGVDTTYFKASADRSTPYASGKLPIVFVGTMDYHPNVDAVCWFAQRILPLLRQSWPQVHFHIVGRNPTAAVSALAGVDVTVSGAVPDVRPWLQHAAAVVAPLRVVRGIINKALEAMAMGRPVVTTTACAESLQAEDGEHLLVAADEAGFVSQLERLFTDRRGAEELGQAARRFVCSAYSWDERMARLDRYLAQAAGVRA
jgi:sugar transferase (PEP-CTERM/EpsH1 system associated)